MLQKLDKLKKLLDIDDNYIGISGLKFEENEDPLTNAIVNDIEALVIKCDDDKKCTKPNPNLTIKPLVNEADDYYIVDEHLPKIPFSLLNCGTRGAGKSVVTLNIVEWMGSHFDQIFIFSPTIELDFKYKITLERLGIEYKVGKNIFYDYDEATLQRIMDKIKHFNKGKKFKDKSKILMIFDDIITLIPKNKRKTIFCCII